MHQRESLSLHQFRALVLGMHLIHLKDVRDIVDRFVYVLELIKKSVLLFDFLIILWVGLLEQAV